MKVLDRRVGDTLYYKYRINLPKSIVEETGLNNKEVIVMKGDGKDIIIKEVNKSNDSQHKHTLSKREKKLQKELIKLVGIGDK